jgi:plasmid stability protein
MQEKQKVTLYLAPELHRKLKIRAAIDTESMSAMVERAVSFYLKHPEKIEEIEGTAQNTYQVHICPECKTPAIVRDGNLVSLKNQPGTVDEELPLKVQVSSHADKTGEEELIPVPC